MTDRFLTCMKGRLDALQAEDGSLMQAAGDIFATSQAASTLADVSEAWRLSPDLGAALLAGDCLRLLQGELSCLSLFIAYHARSCARVSPPQP